MRHKLPEDKKKKSFSLTLDEELLDIFENYLETNKVKNKSKYIENLIRRDMTERGEDTKKDF
jgi:metal-responsive CopG/Arc/MetJ family transcriptional regulator